MLKKCIREAASGEAAKYVFSGDGRALGGGDGLYVVSRDFAKLLIDGGNFHRVNFDSPLYLCCLPPSWSRRSSKTQKDVTGIVW